MEFGKNKNNFQAVRISLLSAVFLMILIAFVYISIYDFKYLSMPLFESAKLLNMKTAAFFIIYSAIFTSMLSSIKLYFDNVNLKNKRIEVAILFATSIIAYFFTFKQIVELYVVISAMGVFYCISGIINLVKETMKKYSG